ncbi:MAG TPA: M6 family metalloprotease domain-containing protein [Fibrobacteria bacterium]|nr:M6 family metalloprotease domain-containing protein [Fibrobacteria bacterium]
MTPISLLGLLAASQVPLDFQPVDWRSLPTRQISSSRVVSARAAAPIAKVLKLLVVPMRYADQDSTYSSDTLSRVFSGPYPYVTVNQFFSQMSNGQFQVEATMLPWQKLSLTRAQALALDEKARQRRFRNEAAAAASRLGVNLSDYDFNGDKIVDGLMIMYAGKSSQESQNVDDQGNMVVTHASSYDTLIGRDTIRQNVFISEVRNDRPSTSGPIAHELSHVIGASDTYDTDPSLYGKSGGLGYWDLMASGSHGLGYYTSTPERSGSFKPTGMSTWVKDDLGFTSPPWIDSAQEIRLKPGQAVKVWADPFRLRQYLYLENRDRAGVDSILPGPGLFVTRVRTSRMLELPNRIAYAINDDSTNLGVEVLEASGEQHIGIRAGSQPLLKDLFTGTVDSLTDNGPVSLKFSDSSQSGLSLRKIRMDGADVVLQVTPPPRHGYALTSRQGRVQSVSAIYSGTQFVYGFRVPTAGAIVAARLALPQNAGPSTLELWKSFSSLQAGGTPLFSTALRAGKSVGSMYYWADVSSPITVNEGDTIFVSQKLGSDLASRQLVMNFDTLPSNAPCWQIRPGSGISKGRNNCPVVDLVIEHEGGLSTIEHGHFTKSFHAKMIGGNITIGGAGSGEVIQAQMRDLRGSLTWHGSIVCDASGNGRMRLDRSLKGLRILEINGSSGRQILTEMVP